MIQRANHDAELHELLIVWEEARERGESLTAESLCRDCPELADELGRQIQALRDWDPLMPDSSPRSSISSEATAPALDCPPASACVTLQLSSLHFHDRGGLGVIYKARHQDLPRDVALKFIRQDRSDDPQCSKRFLREAQITARLEHPGIVPIYGAGRDETGKPCYAMRFVEGTTLEREIKRYHAERAHGHKRSSLETDRAFRALLQRFKSACTTIGYAHSRGVLHRDIKPGNIMLGPFEETLVVDWGLGKIIASDAAETEGAGEDEPEASLPSPASDEVQTFGVIGTPGFMSPEQHAGQGAKVGPASDIYALGATLYVLLTGRSPFDGRLPGEIAAKVMRGEFVLPRHGKPEIPRPLEAICLKAMSLAPEDRYTSAVDLARDLEDWMADAPVSAAGARILASSTCPPLDEPAALHPDGHRRGGGTVVFAVMGLIAILVLQDRSNRHLAARNEELRQARAPSRGKGRAGTERIIDKFHGAVADNRQLKLRPELRTLPPGPSPGTAGFLPTDQAGHRRKPSYLARRRRPGFAKVILKLAAITAETRLEAETRIHAYREGLTILDRLLQNRSDAVELRGLQGRALIDLSKLQRDEGNLPDALSSEERARRILEVVSRDQPDVADHQVDLAVAHDEVGLTHFRAGRPEKSSKPASRTPARSSRKSGNSGSKVRHKWGVSPRFTTIWPWRCAEPAGPKRRWPSTRAR